jgi:hypothetical protein
LKKTNPNTPAITPREGIILDAKATITEVKQWGDFIATYGTEPGQTVILKPDEGRFVERKPTKKFKLSDSPRHYHMADRTLALGTKVLVHIDTVTGSKPYGLAWGIFSKKDQERLCPSANSSKAELPTAKPGHNAMMTQVVVEKAKTPVTTIVGNKPIGWVKVTPPDGRGQYVNCLLADLPKTGYGPGCRFFTWIASEVEGDKPVQMEIHDPRLFDVRQFVSIAEDIRARTQAAA